MKATAAFLACLVLSACALPAARGGGMASDGFQPLRATIYPPNVGTISFAVNRPAHATVFEIIPGQGVRMIYPRFAGESRLLYAGLHSATPLSRANDYAFFTQPQFASYGYQAVSPRYLLLIASERPLNVSEMAGYASSMVLRSSLGYNNFTSFHPFATMDRLAEFVLPANIAPSEWAADVYTYWPQNAASATQPSLRLLNCMDGRQVLVPWTSGLVRCPGDRAVTPQPGQPADSTGEIAVPARRRPGAPPIATDGNGDSETNPPGLIQRRIAEDEARPPHRLPMPVGTDDPDGRFEPVSREPTEPAARPASRRAEPARRAEPRRDASPARSGGRSEPSSSGGRPAPPPPPRMEPPPSPAPTPAPRAEPPPPSPDRRPPLPQ